MDVIIFSFLLLGLLLGVWRGAAKALIIVVATYLPAVLLVYFFDEISNFVDIVISNSGKGNTAVIGALGAISGLIALFAIVVGVFIISRFLIKIVGKGDISLPSRVSGGLIGLLSQNLAATLIYFLMNTAVPSETLSVMREAVWTKANWPFHKVAYPIYQDKFAGRTERFSESVASLGLASTLIGGTGEFNLSAELAQRLNDPKIRAMINEASELAATLDVDALKKQFSELELQDLTTENIDEMIKAEDMKRRTFLNNQLDAVD